MKDGLIKVLGAFGGFISSSHNITREGNANVGHTTDILLFPRLLRNRMSDTGKGRFCSTHTHTFFFFFFWAIHFSEGS